MMENNILKLNKISNSLSCCLGEINSPFLINKKNIKFISISPKYISIKRSKNGNAIIVSREFFGEYLIYKLSLNGEILRVRTNINHTLNIGDNCFLSIDKDSFCFVYPGAYKIYIWLIFISNYICPLSS